MLRDIFNKKRKYATISKQAEREDVPQGLMVKCPSCRKIHYRKELEKNNLICLHCDYHHPMSAKERIDALMDANTFEEWDVQLTSANPLEFPDYIEKVEKDQKKTGMNEAVMTGKGKINGYESAIAVMDSRFRMGSMGSVVGEKSRERLKKREKKDYQLLFSLHQAERECKKAYLV